MITIDEVNHAILACDEESWKKFTAEVVDEHKDTDFIEALEMLRSSWCMSYNFRLDNLIRALRK